MAVVCVFLLCAFLRSCVFGRSVQFLTTLRTPPFICELITDLFPRSAFTSSEDTPDPEALVLDYSYDESVTRSWHSNRTLLMWPAQFPIPATTSNYEEKFTQYLQQLNFTAVVLIADAGDGRIAQCQRLLDTFPTVYADIFVVPHYASESYSLGVVGRMIKPSGRNLFALFTDAVSSRNLIRAFEEKRLMKEGFAFVLCAEAALFQQFGTTADGLLYVAPAVSALARSAEEVERMKLAAVTAWLEGSSILPSIDESPVLVNIRNGTPAVVAASSSIVFPGNTSSIPRRQHSLIPVTVQYESTLADGSVIPGSRVVSRGLQVAFEEKNNSTKMFPMFRVEDRHMELARIWIDYNFTRQKVAENRKSLGLIHFPVPFGSAILTILKVLKEQNVSVPMCMSVGSAALSSPKDYPLYVRPRTSNIYGAQVFAMVFKYFGWKQVAVLYSKDNADNEDLYRAFLNYSEEFHINITNSEASRALTDSLYSGTTKQLNDSLKEIIKSNVRIIAALFEKTDIIIGALCDLSVRSQYLIVTWSGLSGFIFEDEKMRKCRAVAKGALQVFPRLFIGEEGQRVRNQLIAKDGQNFYPKSCLYYDSAMLYLHATDYLIRTGRDYEDPWEIMKAMRSTHFTGCSGTITIAPGLNDKSEAEYSVMNLKYFESNDSFSFEDALYYNPFSVVLFKAVRPFMWPDNSTVFTDTLISTYDCPFLETEVHYYSTGMVIGMASSFSIAAATVAVTAFIWKRWWNKRYPVLNGQNEQSADDLLQMVAIPIEFFQFAAVGPDSHEISYTISRIVNSTTLQLEDVLSATGSTYWYLVKSVFACVGAYTFLSVVKLTNLEKKLEWVPLWTFLMLFANLALPVLSNLLFLPIISILSKLFLCYHAIDEHLTSTFLNKDCYTFCWSGVHLTYVICGSIALALYIPLGVYAKPMWQEAQGQLHIRAQPLALMMKSVVQVVLLTLSNTLKQQYQDIHAGLFFALNVLYLLFKLVVPQYNYHRYPSYRLNLWDAISTCVMLVFCILAFVSRRYSSVSSLCLLAFASVAVTCVAVGVVVQMKVKLFQSHFFRRKMNPSPIFHFAFSFGKRADKYLDMHFNSSFFTENETRSRIPHVSFGNIQ